MFEFIKNIFKCKEIEIPEDEEYTVEYESSLLFHEKEFKVKVFETHMITWFIDIKGKIVKDESVFRRFSPIDKIIPTKEEMLSKVKVTFNGEEMECYFGWSTGDLIEYK